MNIIKFVRDLYLSDDYENIRKSLDEDYGIKLNPNFKLR